MPTRLSVNPLLAIVIKQRNYSDLAVTTMLLKGKLWRFKEREDTRKMVNGAKNVSNIRCREKRNTLFMSHTVFPQVLRRS